MAKSAKKSASPVKPVPTKDDSPRVPKFKFEKGIPFEGSRDRTSWTTYALDLMTVGESYFIPETDAMSKTHRINNAIKTINELPKYKDWQFGTRKWVEIEEGTNKETPGRRIWRNK